MDNGKSANQIARLETIVIKNPLTIQRRLDMAGNMDSELLLKFIGYFPDYLSALLHTLLWFFWTTFVETAVNVVFTWSNKSQAIAPLKRQSRNVVKWLVHRAGTVQT